MSSRIGQGYFAEREVWVEAELERIVKERGYMSEYHKGVLRGALQEEFKHVWQSKDYVYGQDEGVRG